MSWLPSLTTDLVEWWEFEEAGGATRIGSHNESTAVLVGTVGRSALAPANLEYSLDFNAGLVTNYLRADHTRFLFTGDFTINVWFRQYAANAQRWCGNHSVAGNTGYTVGQINAGDALSTNIGNVEVSGGSFSAVTTWTMLTYTLLNGNHVDIYKNGNTTPIFTSGYPGANAAATDAFFIGRGPSGIPVRGYMAQLAVWHKIISAAQLTALYGAGGGLHWPEDHVPSNLTII